VIRDGVVVDATPYVVVGVVVDVVYGLMKRGVVVVGVDMLPGSVVRARLAASLSKGVALRLLGS